MLHYDRKSYEEYRDTIIKFLKPLTIGLTGLIALSAIACYNAAMMRATGESRQACQSESDCPADYICVFNISKDSVLGECVHENAYDPWANRQLEDFIKLKNKKKEEEQWKPIQQNK